MSSTIDRVHFYERQYLRSYDLAAEQLYHMEMRRRLNLALHLWGIVEGLDLRESESVPGLPPRFYVSRGLAIDAYGRELVVPVDYPVTEADLDRNRIQAESEFYLSIAYKRELTTPPSAGYRLCDVKDQYTRWRESFNVLITPTDPTANLGPEPGAADMLPDDPSRLWPVVLGKVTTARPAGGRLIVTGVALAARRYAGVRAQRVTTPASSVSSNQSVALSPFEVQSDLLAGKNMFIGENFAIRNTTAKPKPVDPTDVAQVNPPSTGVLKVKDALFLQGEFYAFIGGEWLTLKEYFQSFIPDVKVGFQEVVTGAAVPPPANVTGGLVREFSIPLDTNLPVVSQQPGNPTMMAAIAAVDGHSGANLGNWASGINNADPFRLAVRFKNATLVSGKSWNFNLEWEVGPWSTTSGGMLPFQKITVSYVAVFRP